MKLYSSPTTPFGRKISVQIIESGLADKVQTAIVAGTPLDPGTMPIERNPLGKIPVLDTPEGVIYDSRVISRYLDDLSGKGLYPAAPLLWKTLTLEATADGITDAAVSMAYELRLRPEALRYPEWLEGQWGKISRALDMIEAQWIGHLGGPLDMAHIALGAALEYLDFRHDARGWRKGRPQLAVWSAEFSKRASMTATQPPSA